MQKYFVGCQTIFDNVIIKKKEFEKRKNIELYARIKMNLKKAWQ